MKNAEGEKVGKKSKKVENNYVNNTKIPPYFLPKIGLWKKLWKVWKSQFYQQKNGKHEANRENKKAIFLRKTEF